ncbi:hypothetical protein [Olleya sp. UBA1516]|uniref:hypothetical protein n=1 Tax=Olleya sp. UBA1516 TaxID=1947013 RepID=UPI0025E012C7|nr:hypothetical protein [Olleya sp. UBA1516]|tara:strand:- start:18026 stop:18640 length:615 start_codon:yes stop_codon:yes gene_type:complete
MKKITILFSCFLILSSCKNEKEKQILDDLKKCIDKNLNEDVSKKNGKENFDYLNFVTQFEEKLLSSNFLINNDQVNYYNLLNSIINSDNDYLLLFDKMNILIDNNGFDPFSTEYLFNQCPFLASNSSKEKEGFYLFTQGKLLNQMIEVGFNDVNLLSEFIKIVDRKRFENIIYRSPTILLVMINLDIKYNQEKWKSTKIDNVVK